VSGADEKCGKYETTKKMLRVAAGGKMLLGENMEKMDGCPAIFQFFSILVSHHSHRAKCANHYILITKY
jgi:hypothetical protein